MNRGIYSVSSGMDVLQQQLDIVSNNLANASTNGFKQDKLVFNEALQRELGFSQSGQTVGSLGSGPGFVSQYTDMQQGPLTTTNNPLDVAIEGYQGMFAVKTPDGLRYTRDGAFTLDKDRNVVDRMGDAVLDDRGQPINLPEGMVEIHDDGSIYVNNASVANLGVWNGTFTKEGSNLWTSPKVDLMANPVVHSRELEGSNVNAMEGMLSLIQINRTFEMAQKAIQQQDESTSKLLTTIS